MAQPYVGEIRMFGGNFAPLGWMFCEGQLLAIADNDVLFNLIGTTYGGDGQQTFALPDLRGRVPIHFGNGFTLAETGGAESVTLTTNQIPAHTHTPQSNDGNGTSTNPANNVWAAQPALMQYAGSGSENVSLPVNAIGSTGGSQPHDNMMPFLVVDYIISLFGIFPSPS
jgi:microcystin-dependent protein